MSPKSNIKQNMTRSIQKNKLIQNILNTLNLRFNLSTVVTGYVKLNLKLNLKLNILNESFSQVKFGLVKLNFNLTRLIFTEVTVISQVRI